MFSTEHINDFNESLGNASIRVLAEDVRTTCQILEVRGSYSYKHISKLSALMIL